MAHLYSVQGEMDRQENDLQGTQESAPATSCGIDPADAAALYVNYGEELRRFVVGILKDHHAANDVLQATFAKVVEKGGSARSETVKAWLFRVALNEALLLRRKQATHRKHSEQWAARPKVAGERPEESIVRGETVEQVRSVMQTLPPEQLEVVKLRIYEEMPFAKIAEKLNLPLGTVLTRMRLALGKLKKSMAED